MRTSIFVALTYHGRGHIALTAPLIQALQSKYPDSKFIIESAAPREVLRSHIPVKFDLHSTSSDFGLLMDGSLTVRAQDTHDRYKAIHAQLESETAAVMRRLQECNPSLVLSNAGYMPLLAARRLGIPSIGFCCLNWAEIYRAACGGFPGADQIYSQMVEAYNRADVFIRPQPFIDMPGLGNLEACGPVARRGHKVKSALLAHLGLPDGHKIVTVFMGGIRTEIDFTGWPVIPGVTWLVNETNRPARKDFYAIDELPFPYVDVATSSDAIISKLGYATVTEAACHGVPVLYVRRHNWPEDDPFAQWLSSVGRCLEIKPQDLNGAGLTNALQRIWAMPVKAPIKPTGISEAVEIIEKYIQ